MGVRRRRLAVPAVSLALLTSLVLFLRVDAVTVRLPRENNRLFAAVRVAAGDEVRLWYRHSVEKTVVEGVFVAGAGPVLQARETRMASVGSGLPNTRTRREGSWLVVDEGLAPLEEGLDFFISAVNDTRMTISGTPVAVDTLASGSVIGIDVARIRLWDWILWHYSNLDWRKDGK